MIERMRCSILTRKYTFKYRDKMFPIQRSGVRSNFRAREMRENSLRPRLELIFSTEARVCVTLQVT